MEPSNLKTRGFMVGAQFIDMTQDELVEHSINGFVNSQISAAQRVSEVSQSEGFAKLSHGTANATAPTDTRRD